MPRISAPTLAEHRDQRMNALLAAGRQLALDQGIRAVTMAAVAARTGLSRPAVYEYFRSTDELVAALVEDEVRNKVGSVIEGLAQEPDAQGRIARYVRDSIDLIRHDALLAPSTESVMSAADRARVAQLRAEISEPVRQAVADLDILDVDGAVMMIDGTIESTVRRLELDPVNACANAATAAAVSFVSAGLQALASVR